MPTSFTPSTAKSELEAMNLHSHQIFKNQTSESENRRYREHLLEISGGSKAKDLKAEMEAIYTRVHV